MQSHLLKVLDGKGVSHLGELTDLGEEDRVVLNFWAAFEMHR